jgi:lysophospholipase L1-like esterase
MADPYLLADGEAARLLAGHPWQRFAVLGDSIAEGIGEALAGYPDLPWTQLIASALAVHRPQLVYLNLGKRDTRAAQVVHTQLGKGTEFAPDLTLIACGGYDVLQPAFSPSSVESALDTLVRAFRRIGSDVITVSMFDGSYNPLVPQQHRRTLQVRLHELSRITREVAEKLGTIHVDLLDHPAARENIYSSDGRHGNRRGHAIAAAQTIRRLGAHLAGAAPSATGAQL